MPGDRHHWKSQRRPQGPHHFPGPTHPHLHHSQLGLCPRDWTCIHQRTLEISIWARLPRRDGALILKHTLGCEPKAHQATWISAWKPMQGSVLFLNARLPGTKQRGNFCEIHHLGRRAGRPSGQAASCRGVGKVSRGFSGCSVSMQTEPSCAGPQPI